MPYTPPVGVVDLNLTGEYTPPVGVVNLNLTDPATARSVTIAAVTAPPTAAVQVLRARRVTIAAVTAPPTAAVTAVKVRAVVVSAMTAPPTASSYVSTDLNLPPLVCARAAASWRTAAALPMSASESWSPARAAHGTGRGAWGAADPIRARIADAWSTALPASGAGSEHWRDAGAYSAVADSDWKQADTTTGESRGRWRTAAPLPTDAITGWKPMLPLRTRALGERWAQGGMLSTSVVDRFGDGRLLVVLLRERWRSAGYPNCPAPTPPTPPTPPPPYNPPVGFVALDLRCPLPTSPGLIRLNLADTPCPAIARREIPIQRTYRVLNTAYMVRLPERTPLPVTELSVETDCDSWCWSLSATLLGPDFWALVQPDPLPKEVEVSINGHVWRLMLDYPSVARTFAQTQGRVGGLSRSAWLTAPYTAATAGVESNPRTANQLAEQALENLGWTLVWDMPDWLVPANLYGWNGTPIDQLVSLVKPVDGCLYSDPALAIITAYPRYPTASWLWDGETADVAIPEDALLSWDSQPDIRPTINGCYVSGTVAGVNAWVKIAGTDGALQPTEPVVDALLCDEDGVAATARGLAVLSAAGAGSTISVECLLTESGGAAPGLLRPGQFVEVAGQKARVRSVKIRARWQDGLQVRQSLSLERREVEA